MARPAIRSRMKGRVWLNGISHMARPPTIAAAPAAPAATVIGTMKRRQWNQAAIAALRPASEATRPAPSFCASGINGPISSAAVKAMPPTKASSSRIEGSAMRRRRVKYSARPQAVPATNRPDTKEGWCGVVMPR